MGAPVTLFSLHEVEIALVEVGTSSWTDAAQRTHCVLHGLCVPSCAFEIGSRHNSGKSGRAAAGDQGKTKGINGVGVDSRLG